MSPSFSAWARRIWNTSSCFFIDGGAGDLQALGHLDQLLDVQLLEDRQVEAARGLGGGTVARTSPSPAARPRPRPAAAGAAAAGLAPRRGARWAPARGPPPVGAAPAGGAARRAAVDGSPGRRGERVRRLVAACGLPGRKRKGAQARPPLRPMGTIVEAAPRQRRPGRWARLVGSMSFASSQARTTAVLRAAARRALALVREAPERILELAVDAALEASERARARRRRANRERRIQPARSRRQGAPARGGAPRPSSSSSEKPWSSLQPRVTCTMSPSGVEERLRLARAARERPLEAVPVDRDPRVPLASAGVRHRRPSAERHLQLARTRAARLSPSCTASSVVSGAISRSSRPSAPPRSTAMSVTIRCTQRRPVRGSVHCVEDLRGAVLRRVLHGDDDPAGPGHEVHGAAHSLHHLAGDRPVGEVALAVDLRARRGSSGPRARRAPSRRSRRWRSTTVPGSSVTVSLPALMRSASSWPGSG